MTSKQTLEKINLNVLVEMQGFLINVTERIKEVTGIIISENIELSPELDKSMHEVIIKFNQVVSALNVIDVVIGNKIFNNLDLGNFEKFNSDIHLLRVHIINKKQEEQKDLQSESEVVKTDVGAKGFKVNFNEKK